MDVIYLGHLSPAWGIRGHVLSQFPQIWRVFTPFFVWPNFGQKKVLNKRTLKYQELTENPIPKLVSDRYIYPQFYIHFASSGHIKRKRSLKIPEFWLPPSSPLVRPCSFSSTPSSFSLDGSRQYLFFSLVLVYIAFWNSLFIKGPWLPLTNFFLKGAYLSIASKKDFGFSLGALDLKNVEISLW